MKQKCINLGLLIRTLLIQSTRITKRTKELRGKLIKYAGDRLQERNISTEKLMNYAKNVSLVSKELMHSSALLAIHKKIFVDPSPES